MFFFVALYEEEFKLDGGPKQSNENLAPPVYEDLDNPRVSGSYELPPGYPIGD